MKVNKLKVISLHFRTKSIQKIYKARKAGNPYENRYLKGI